MGQQGHADAKGRRAARLQVQPASATVTAALTVGPTEALQDNLGNTLVLDSLSSENGPIGEVIKTTALSEVSGVPMESGNQANLRRMRQARSRS